MKKNFFTLKKTIFQRVKMIITITTTLITFLLVLNVRFDSIYFKQESKLLELIY